MSKPLIRWLLLTGYCLLIFIQSSLPSPDFTSEIIGFDKLSHLAAYAVMAYLACHAFTTWPRLRKVGAVTVAGILFAILFGLSDEWHQSFIPGRIADGWDFLADAIGAFLGGGFYGLRHRAAIDPRSSSLGRGGRP